MFEVPESDNDDWTLETFADLNRQRMWLQRSKYDTLAKEYQGELEAAFHLSCRCNWGNASTSSTISDLDPLSVFAMEADAKARRTQRIMLSTLDADLIIEEEDDEESNSNNNFEDLEENEDIEEILSTINKDLKRLQLEHNEVYVEHMKQKCDCDPEEAIEQRCAQLKAVLYFFAREYPKLGYQQGMHELASLLLLVAEIDTLDASTSSMLLDPTYILHDTYAMVEALFQKVGPAYNGDNLDVVSKIRCVSGEGKFLRYMVAMEVQPELYCARWIRLLFSREVNHWRTMLPLWDILFDVTSEHASVLSLGDVSRYTRPGLTPVLIPGKINWLTVLETAAASLIWIHRAELLAMEPEDGFCWLVNMPPMTTVNRLVATLLSTLRRVQKGQKPKRTDMEGDVPGTRRASSSKSPTRRTWSRSPTRNDTTSALSRSWSRSPTRNDTTSAVSRSWSNRSPTRSWSNRSAPRNTSPMSSQGDWSPKRAASSSDFSYDAIMDSVGRTFASISPSNENPSNERTTAPLKLPSFPPFLRSNSTKSTGSTSAQ